MEISNTADTSVRRDFKALVVEWKAACGHLATVKAMTQHPAYEKIIELGEGIVPLLLEELAREPHHWFAALRRITGANPVRPEHRGDLRMMAKSWTEWGRENGYWQ